jgi:flagellar hook assembly protein FlgD
LRHLAIVLVAAFAALCVLGAPAHPALAAGGTKVVVVAGPAGAYNAHYRSDADAIAAEARRYTSNVVELVTPNATWARVRAAAQGASVFVYLGHGNGWPSPYPPFRAATQDGLGLDPNTGANGSAHVYYGEDYLRSFVRFAPNAVVLLYHLCYASGNTEPGLPVGTLSDSRSRVDNYGAGFIGAGARAVLAEGHPDRDVTSYIRQLFTTNRTMDQVFRSAATSHGHVLGPYASQRTPGLAYEMDPDTATSGFYRSVVGDLSLRAGVVRGAPPAPTGANPPDFVVPGAAAVTGASGTGLFATAAAAANPAARPRRTLALGTRLRVTAEAHPAPDGTRILKVTLLGSTTAGFVRATGVAPRDSAPTVAWSLDQSAAWLSPNGDGVSEQLVVATRLSEVARASIVVKNAAGTVVWKAGATGDIVRFAWALRTATRARIPDGRYSWTLRATDTWGNGGVARSGSFTVDRTPPVTKATTSGTAGRNGWLQSSATVALAAADARSGVASTWWQAGASARRYVAPMAVTGDGTHTLRYRSIDRAGVAEAWRTLTLRIDATPPTISIRLTGTAGVAAGTYRGHVTITPAIADATSGVASRTAAVDGAAAVALRTPGVVVTGEGLHTITVSAVDAAGNRASQTATFTIDTVAPAVDLPVPTTPPVVTPNGDGATETVSLPFSISEPATVTATVTAPDGATVVRTMVAVVAAGPRSFAWDGRTAGGRAVGDGRYTVSVRAVDAAGNVSVPVSVPVDVYGALAAVTRTPALFFPQDGDRLAPKTTVSFRLRAPARVSITILDGAGAIVRTVMTDRAYRAGRVTWAWNGKLANGTFVPRGFYRIVVRATNGTQAATQSVLVQADAFRISTTATTVVTGTAFTVTATSAEPLVTAPVVVVRQPGVRAWTVTMRRISTGRWSARIVPRAGGTPGSMSLTVRARDAAGRTNSSVVNLTVE